MTGRAIIEVDRKASATRELPAVALKDLGILERGDLQEWILKSPALLGKDIKVLDYEFDQFSAKRDRVDILALDTDGRVVIVELKRDEHGGHADLQALRYAAKVRGLSFTEIVKIHQNALGRDGAPQTDIDSAERALLDLLDESDATLVELDPHPRIILASAGFSKDLTTTVLYLRDHGIDIRCVELSAYDQGNDIIVLVPDVIIPLRGVEDFTARVELRDGNPSQEPRTGRRKRPNVVPYMVKHGLLRDGEALRLKHNLPSGIAFDAANPDFQATVVAPEGRTAKLRWKADGELYSASNLAAQVFKKYKPEGSFDSVPGPWHWGTDASPLSTIAFEHMDRGGNESAQDDDSGGA
jgi:hypothetical protein